MLQRATTGASGGGGTDTFLYGKSVNYNVVESFTMDDVDEFYVTCGYKNFGLFKYSNGSFTKISGDNDYFTNGSVTFTKSGTNCTIKQTVTSNYLEVTFFRTT